MKTLKMSEGDLSFEKGTFVLEEGPEEVTQSLENLIKIRMGEFVLDEFVGLDRERLLGKSVDLDEARDDIVSCLSQDERVDLVNDIEMDVKDRTAKVTFRVTLAGGDEVIGGVEINA